MAIGKKACSEIISMQNRDRNLKDAAVRRIVETQCRIAVLDQAGPHLNAVLEWNPDADGIAAGLDRERAEIGVSGPLHGIPVLLKDNIGTGDAMHTTAGSLALADRYAPADAMVASRLRSAGAVLCGKTNMTELANFMTENMPNGYSSRGGTVRHAWKENGDPSGSSTGSAVAVAAGYVPLAVGTETCGSIISPAIQAGIAALKPTVGWVSRNGIIPISPSQDTAGPMARTVRDCALAFSIMAGYDPADPVTETCIGRSVPGLLDCSAHEGGLAGIRLGIFLQDENGTETKFPAFHAALGILEKLGAELVPFAPPPVDEKDMLEVLLHEFRPAFDATLREDAQSVRTMADLAAFNLQHPASCLQYGQIWIDKALALHRPMLTEAYSDARGRIRTALVELERRFTEGNAELSGAKGGLDAVVSPNGLFVFPVTGAPALTFPVGFDESAGIPVPLVLNGLPFSEAKLFGIGAALEDAVRAEWQPVWPFSSYAR